MFNIEVSTLPCPYQLHMYNSLTWIIEYVCIMLISTQATTSIESIQFNVEETSGV